jgi:hypothetical protein
MKKCIILLLTIAASTGCSKGPGPGGRAKIKGKVFGINLDKSLSIVRDSAFVGDEKIFISYGDVTTVGDDVTSSFDGSFEFDYLRPGKYKIWAFSKKINGVNKMDTAIVQDVVISGKSEEKDMGTIRIYTNKN